jgi:hypothetical protein
MKIHRLLLAALAAAASSGCTALSPAKPQVSDVRTEAAFGVDAQGDPDAGYSISFTITNNGQTGDVLIMPKLSTSEGEWTRQQTLRFAAGESRELSYKFLEPTIQATNIQGSVSTLP